MGSLVTAAKAVAQQLVDAGVSATIDPAKAANMRPCVLVPPPAVDYVERLNTWRLVCLSSRPAGDVDALAQLDELVQAVGQLLPIEAADPAGYPLTTDTGPVPAYVLRFTT